MATTWYLGSDGVEYPQETEDREDQHTCEICGSPGAFWRDTYGSLGAFVCLTCSDNEGQDTCKIDLPLADALHVVARAVAYERIGCADLPIDWPSIFAQVDTLRRDLEALRDHRCTWSSNDYCMVCGADGRA